MSVVPMRAHIQFPEYTSLKNFQARYHSHTLVHSIEYNSPALNKQDVYSEVRLSRSPIVARPSKDLWHAGQVVDIAPESMPDDVAWHEAASDSEPQASAPAVSALQHSILETQHYR